MRVNEKVKQEYERLQGKPMPHTTDEPYCPSCGNYNAMLSSYIKHDDGSFNSDVLKCRDCGFTVKGDS